jgi:hypothetical protein
MLKIRQRFDKHFNCHLQGEYIFVSRFRKPYIRQAVSNWRVGFDGADWWSGRAGCLNREFISNWVAARLSTVRTRTKSDTHTRREGKSFYVFIGDGKIFSTRAKLTELDFWQTRQEWSCGYCVFLIVRSLYDVHIGLIMSVCPYDSNREPPDGFGWNLVWTLCHWNGP